MFSLRKFAIILSFSIALIALVFVIGSWSVDKPSLSQEVQERGQQAQLRVADRLLTLHVVATLEERAEGLSGFSSLGENEGMFFVFEKPGFYGFWMKEMQFPIDIIWLDVEFRIVHIEKGVLPSSFPEIFNPITPAQYVLEVNSGFSVQNNLKVGDEVIFLPRKS